MRRRRISFHAPDDWPTALPTEREENAIRGVGTKSLALDGVDGCAGRPAGGMR